MLVPWLSLDKQRFSRRIHYCPFLHNSLAGSENDGKKKSTTIDGKRAGLARIVIALLKEVRVSLEWRAHICNGFYNFSAKQLMTMFS